LKFRKKLSWPYCVWTMTNSQLKANSPSGLISRMLPGFLISALALLALYFLVDIGELRNAFAQADFRWIPVVALVFVGTLAARAMAWRTLLEERASFKDSFIVLNQSYLLNNILPLRLGELGRALLLGERTGLKFWQVMSTVIVERIFDVGLASALIFVTLPFVIGADWARSAALVALAFVLLGFALLLMLAVNPILILNIIRKLSQPWPKAQAWIIERLQEFMQGLAALRDVGRFFRVAFWMLTAWLFNIAWYFLLLRSFFPDAQWLWAAFAVGASSMGVALPSSPAYIGVLEGVLVWSLSLFGIDPSLSLAYAIVAHAVYFVITGAIGLYGFTQQGQSLGNVYQQLLTRSRRSRKISR